MEKNPPNSIVPQKPPLSDGKNDQNIDRTTSKTLTLFMAIISFAPLLIQYYSVPLSVLVGAILFCINLYGVNVVQLILGPINSKNASILPEKERNKINFLVSLGCLFVVLGVNQVFGSTLDLVVLFFKQNTLWSMANISIFLYIFAGIIIALIGWEIISYLTLRPLLKIGRERQQILTSTLKGFVLFSAFLGVGGETLQSFVVLGINCWFFIKSFKSVKKLQDVYSLMENVGENKENLENSFWANWVNFYKTAYSRFYGVFFVSTGFFFGLNFRFWSLAVENQEAPLLIFLQITLIGMLGLPFVLSNLGLKFSWQTPERLILTILPIFGFFIYIFLLPEAVPFLYAILQAFPDSRTRVQMYLGWAFIVLYIIFLINSLARAQAQIINRSPSDAVDDLAIYLLEDIFTFLGITVEIFILGLYAVNEKQIDSSIQFWFYLFTGLILGIGYSVNYFLRRNELFREIFLTLRLCPLCQKPLPKNNPKCDNCNGSIMEIGRKYKQDHVVGFKKRQLVLPFLCIFSAAVVEVFYFTGLFLIFIGLSSGYTILLITVLGKDNSKKQ